MRKTATIELTKEHRFGRLVKVGDDCRNTSARVHEALPILLDAHLAAQDVGADPWDFAVEIVDLQHRGLMACDLRWMLCKGLVEHAEEITGSTGMRRFRRCNQLRFSNRSCFILTPRGLEWTEGHADGVDELHSRKCDFEPPSPMLPLNVAPLTSTHAADGSDTVARPDGKPVWDAEVQELRVGGRLVKQFRGPASNQMLILAAFQETNWPRRIDDPLRPSPEIDPKKRLHDTINALNRNQKSQLIQFAGDGTGRGVLFELIAPTPFQLNGHSHYRCTSF